MDSELTEGIVIMEIVLVLAATESDGSLGKAARETLSGAKELAAGLGGAKLFVGLLGGETQAAADSLAACGAEKIFSVAGADFAQPRYGTDAAAAEAIVRAAGATLVLAPATSRISRILSGVAHRLGGRIDTHATGVIARDGAPLLTRWYYRQRMMANLKRTQRPWFMTIESGSWTDWSGAPGKAAVETVAVTLADAAKRTTVTGTQSPSVGEQTIRPDAELLFVAGAGWCKKQRSGQLRVADAEKLILDFLRKTQSSLGGSKSLVDQSGEGATVLRFMTHLNQIGQTGSTPRHPKGLATCCHGEEPHVVGWRFVNERRAINLDAGCGWAQGKADVLYVADAFEVMEKVNALLAGK